jgi:DNA-binding XRE family transcriptional regulator
MATQEVTIISEAGIRELRATLGLSQETLANILGVSWRTLARWEEGGGEPSKRVEEKLRKLRQCANSLSAAIQAERIPQWMHLPNEALGGNAPRDVLLEDEGIDRVARVAGWLEWGIPS